MEELPDCHKYRVVRRILRESHGDRKARHSPVGRGLTALSVAREGRLRRGTNRRRIPAAGVSSAAHGAVQGWGCVGGGRGKGQNW